MKKSYGSILIFLVLTIYCGKSEIKQDPESITNPQMLSEKENTIVEQEIQISQKMEDNDKQANDSIPEEEKFPVLSRVEFDSSKFVPYDSSYYNSQEKVILVVKENTVYVYDLISGKVTKKENIKPLENILKNRSMIVTQKVEEDSGITHYYRWDYKTNEEPLIATRKVKTDGRGGYLWIFPKDSKFTKKDEWLFSDYNFESYDNILEVPEVKCNSNFLSGAFIKYKSKKIFSDNCLESIELKYSPKKDLIFIITVPYRYSFVLDLKTSATFKAPFSFTDVFFTPDSKSMLVEYKNKYVQFDFRSPIKTKPCNQGDPRYCANFEEYMKKVMIINIFDMKPFDLNTWITDTKYFFSKKKNNTHLIDENMNYIGDVYLTENGISITTKTPDGIKIFLGDERDQKFFQLFDTEGISIDPKYMDRYIDKDLFSNLVLSTQK